MASASAVSPSARAGLVVDGRAAVATRRLTKLFGTAPALLLADDELWIDALRSTLDDGQIDGSWSLHLAAGGSVVPVVEAPSWVWTR